MASHENQAIGRKILERAKTGDAAAIEWIRKFILDAFSDERMPNLTGQRVKVMLECFQVMLDDHMDHIHRHEERN